MFGGVFNFYGGVLILVFMLLWVGQTICRLPNDLLELRLHFQKKNGGKKFWIALGIASFFGAGIFWDYFIHDPTGSDQLVQSFNRCFYIVQRISIKEQSKNRVVVFQESYLLYLFKQSSSASRKSEASLIPSCAANRFKRSICAGV